MSGGNDGVSSGEGHETPGPESFSRKNEDDMQADDEVEEEESNTEPILMPNRGPNGDPDSGRVKTRREPAATQTSEHATASGHSAKRDRQALRLGRSRTPVTITISDDSRQLERYASLRPKRHWH